MFNPRNVTLTVLLLTVISCAAVLGAGPSVSVLPPSAYTGPDRAAFTAGVDAIGRQLQAGYPVPRARLVKLGWSEPQFVDLAAGTLRQAGFRVLLADGDFAGTPHTWILVGIELSAGYAWVPVEASPVWLSSEWQFGAIAWQGAPGAAFDPRYSAFTATRELAANRPPQIVLMPPRTAVVIDEDTTFLVTGSDPDGTIIAYIWTIDGEETLVDTRAMFRYAFSKLGEHHVALEVVDNLGGRTAASVDLEVLAEDPGCGCHD